MPYIERFNGNLLVKEKKYENAIAHYNKSLLSLQMLFKMEQDPVIKTQEQAIKFIKEIEIIVCVNLAHCYIEIKNYHYAIKYCNQALEKDEQHVKALYRLALAYTKIGELDRAKETIRRLMDTDREQSMQNEVTKLLNEVRQVEVRNRDNEKKML